MSQLQDLVGVITGGASGLLQPHFPEKYQGATAAERDGKLFLLPKTSTG